jgi:hypothetical protein
MNAGLTSHGRGYLAPSTAHHASSSELDLPLTRSAALPAGFEEDNRDGLYGIRGPLDADTSSTYNGRYGDPYEEPSKRSGAAGAGGKHNIMDEESPSGLENVESLSWDFTAPGVAPPAPRRRGVLAKVKSFDYTLGLGGGSWSDLLPGRRADEVDPRTIYVNDPTRNKVEGKKWKGNAVSTSKYNVITFLPKFLLGEYGLERF